MVCSQVDHSFAMLQFLFPNCLNMVFFSPILDILILWAIESYESYDDLCLWVCGIYLKRLGMVYQHKQQLSSGQMVEIPQNIVVNFMKSDFSLGKIMVDHHESSIQKGTF